MHNIDINMFTIKTTAQVSKIVPVVISKIKLGILNSTNKICNIILNWDKHVLSFRIDLIKQKIDCQLSWGFLFKNLWNFELYTHFEKLNSSKKHFFSIINKLQQSLNPLKQKVEQYIEIRYQNQNFEINLEFSSLRGLVPGE